MARDNGSRRQCHYHTFELLLEMHVHGSDIRALRQNVVGHKKWIFVYRILC